MRILAGAQGTGRQQVLRLDRDPRESITAATLEELLRRLRTLARTGVRGIHLSDYGHGVMHPALVEDITRLAHHGVPVVVDSRYGLAAFRGPVVLKPNAPELSDLVGRPVVNAQDVVHASKEVIRRLSARAVVATRGRDGMVVVPAKGPPTLLPAHGTGEVTDVTGAGDTVGAALTCALAAGATLETAARMANVAASIVVKKLGAATATPQEILAAITPQQRGG
jgi:rfaE bifunctional protein kinase chain/domain